MEYDEFQEILWGDHDDYESVTEETIEDTSRWSIYYGQVFKQKSTGKFFYASWGSGATEMQDGQQHDWSLSEVEPFEKVIVSYKNVKNGIKHKGFD